MTSNYKKLGQYIRQVSGRNADLSVTNLQGVSITKKFIPSIANTIGTNMSTYKIVRRNQFAYGPVTSRNGEKISVALLDQDEAFISQAYTVFEVINHDLLDPEYLMMWFRRPEFDRYARFKSHGSVREIFGWDEMCDVELPIPGITEQRRIVEEYKAIRACVNGYRLKNKKLVELAQSVYSYNIKEADNLVPIRSLVKANTANLSTKRELKTIKYLDTSSITRNKINEYQILTVGINTIPSRAKRLVQHGDVVYSTVRPNLEHYGVIYEPSDNIVVSTGFAVLSPFRISSEQLLLFLMRTETTAYLQGKADMSTTTYPSIQVEDIMDLKIPIISDVLQSQKLTDVLKTILMELKDNYQKMKLLQDFQELVQNKMSVSSGVAV